MKEQIKELKPCPFCGNKEIGFRYSHKSPTVGNGFINLTTRTIRIRQAVCTDCKSCSDWYDTQKDCISAWNTRHLSQTSEVGKCVRCKGTGKDGHDRCDPPSWYICEDCNGTGQSEVTDGEIEKEVTFLIAGKCHNDLATKGAVQDIIGWYRTHHSQAPQLTEDKVELEMIKDIATTGLNILNDNGDLYIRGVLEDILFNVNQLIKKED